MGEGEVSEWPTGQFGSIVVDPPWRYTKVPTARTGSGASAEHIYPTMRTEDIRDLPVAFLAAPKAHLYLWVTNPVLLNLRPDIKGHVSALQICEAWGFTPVTLLTWVKSTKAGAPDRGGLGWYFRGATEHVLFAQRGNLGIPAALREPNIFLSPRGPHSAKPECLQDTIERVSPGPYLELFGRRQRPGWTTWGNEI